MKYFKYAVLFAFFTFMINSAHGQNDRITEGWGIGLSAGILNTNLLSADDFFSEGINPFLLAQDDKLSLRLNLQYDFSPYESIRVDISTGKFSVMTNYLAWPSLVYTNEFINSTVSTQLSLMRYLGVSTYPLNIYGKFGFGFNLNSLSVTANDTEESIEPENMRTQNPIYTIGSGMRLTISSNLNLFTEYDLFLSDKNIIDSRFINNHIDSDFTRTSSRWRNFQLGIQIQFQRRDTPPVHDRFPSEPFQPLAPSNNFPVYFETVYIEKPALETLDTFNEIITNLSIENNQRFDSYSDITNPITDNKSFFDTVFASGNDLHLEPNGTEGEAVEETPITKLTPHEPVYGTTGTWNNSGVEGYTIVIHSLQNESNAHRIADELRSSGFRVMVKTVPVNDAVFYRVAIGQYETNTKAIQAAKQLPDAYSNQYFLMVLP